MQSSRQSFQAACLIARIPTDQLSHLWDCFTSKEKRRGGQRPDPRPWISVLRAIIRGSQVTLLFFLAITLDQRMCPSALHFGTLHKGDPGGQGMVSHKTALSLLSYQPYQILWGEGGLEAGLPGSAQIIKMPF